jgi:hypothetical protein
MKFHIKYLAKAVGILFLAAFTGCSQGRKNFVKPLVAIEPAEIDIGNVDQDQIIERSVTIINQSDVVIAITKFNRSCGCTSVYAPKNELQPREQEPLTLRIDTHGKVGKIDIYAGIEWKSPGNQLVSDDNVLITGKVTLIATMDPPVLRLANVDASLKTLSAKFILRHGDSRTKWDDIRLQSDGFTLTKTRLPTNDFLIETCCNPSRLPIGVFKPTLTLDLLDSSKGLVVKSYMIPVVMNIVTDLIVSPASVFLSVQPTNSTINGTITLKSSQDLRFFGWETSRPSKLSLKVQTETETKLVFRYEFSSGKEIGDQSGMISILVGVKGIKKRVNIPYLCYVAAP